jgi:hypothetical protein
LEAERFAKIIQFLSLYKIVPPVFAAGVNVEQVARSVVIEVLTRLLKEENSGKGWLDATTNLIKEAQASLDKSKQF